LKDYPRLSRDKAIAFYQRKLNESKCEAQRKFWQEKLNEAQPKTKGLFEGEK